MYDDNLLEYNETFTISITIDDPTLSDRISTNTATVVIIDNDRKLYTFGSSYTMKLAAVTVSFNQSVVNKTQEDSGTAQFELLFSNPSIFELNISVDAISDTALSEQPI